MNREQKRAAQFKRGQRFTPHGARASENDLAHNRIAHALVRARSDLAELAEALPLASDNLARARASNGNIRVRADLSQALPLGGSQVQQLCDALGDLCNGLTVPPSPEELLGAILGGTP